MKDGVERGSFHGRDSTLTSIAVARGQGGAARTAPARCPLCDETTASVLWRLRYAEIWSRLEQELGVRFGADVVRRNSGSEATELRRCRGCGLEYFAPQVPGDASFYERLAAGMPEYEPERWEFAFARKRIGARDAVADFGCGSGNFLLSLRDRAGRLAGVDHSPESIRRARALGLECELGGFGEFAARHRGEFDLACAFQVIEHLPRVADIVEPMITTLRRRGRLLISVPDRERYAMDSPLDLPPHHLSRWSPSQLAELGPRFGLRVRSIERQPPDYSHAVLHAQRRMDPLLTRLPPSPNRLIGGAHRRLWLPERRYRRRVERGSYARRGVYGHSILAEYERGP